MALTFDRSELDHGEPDHSELALREPSTVTTNEVVRRPGGGRWAALLLLVGGVVTAGGLIGYAASPGHDHAHDDHEAADHQTAGAESYEAQSAAVGPPFPGIQPVGTFDPTASVANYDASVVAAVVDSALVYTEPGGPINAHWVDLPPGFELRAISTDGTRAALVNVDTGDDGRVVGSDVLIADRANDPATVTIHHLEGLVEPEAFATDGRSLFVIDHQAGSEPGTYRVRPLNLETGELEEMLGPTKVPLIEDMNGAGRRQMWGFDDGRLYTLYIRQTEHVHASGRPGSDGFVHILDLDEEWAFCLDLPQQFGKGDLSTTAMAVGATRLAVLDLSAGDGGQLVYASLEDRTVTDVIDLPLAFRRTMKAMLVAAADQPGRPADWRPPVHIALHGTVIAVGVGDAVVWFDNATLEPLATDPNDAYDDRIELPGPLVGLTTVPGNGVLAWTSGDQGPTQLAPPRR